MTAQSFKTPQGKFRTQSLFWEYRVPEAVPIFTIKDEDHEVDGVVYKSLKKLYMAYDHIPEFEYEFAKEVLGGWGHWNAIVKNKLFTNLVSRWRLEKEVELQAKAYSAMIHTAMFEGSKGTTAAKFLAEKGWKGTGRGRPSKEEVERERKQQAALMDEFTEDLERIGLTALDGGKK